MQASSSLPSREERSRMPYYRLYYLNRGSGHIDRAEEIDAADDVRAVAIVRERERDTAVELWQQSRKVMRLEGSTDGSAQADGAQLRNAAAAWSRSPPARVIETRRHG
jgi:hypothetical protein